MDKTRKRHKTKINPLKLIVTDAPTNFVQDLYNQLRYRVSMKQFGQAYMKRIVFLSILYNIIDNLKYSVTFTLGNKILENLSHD